MRKEIDPTTQFIYNHCYAYVDGYCLRVEPGRLVYKVHVLDEPWTGFTFVDDPEQRVMRGSVPMVFVLDTEENRARLSVIAEKRKSMYALSGQIDAEVAKLQTLLDMWWSKA